MLEFSPIPPHRRVGKSCAWPSQTQWVIWVWKVERRGENISLTTTITTNRTKFESFTHLFRSALTFSAEMWSGFMMSTPTYWLCCPQATFSPENVLGSFICLLFIHYSTIVSKCIILFSWDEFISRVISTLFPSVLWLKFYFHQTRGHVFCMYLVFCYLWYNTFLLIKCIFKPCMDMTLCTVVNVIPLPARRVACFLSVLLFAMFTCFVFV